MNIWRSISSGHFTCVRYFVVFVTLSCYYNDRNLVLLTNLLFAVNIGHNLQVIIPVNQQVLFIGFRIFCRLLTLFCKFEKKTCLKKKGKKVPINFIWGSSYPVCVCVCVCVGGGGGG